MNQIHVDLMSFQQIDRVIKHSLLFIHMSIEYRKGSRPSRDFIKSIIQLNESTRQLLNFYPNEFIQDKILEVKNGINQEDNEFISENEISQGEDQQRIPGEFEEIHGGKN